MTSDSLVLARRLRPGWIRVRLEAAGGPARWRLVEGEGGCLLETPPLTGTAGEFHLRLSRPVDSLRVEPMDGGDAWLTRLEVAEVSSGRIFLRALAGKMALLAKYGSARRAIGRGAGLLLRGQFGTFLIKLRKGLDGPTFDAPPDYDADRAYRDWIRRQRRQEPAAPASDAPRFSVVMAVVEGSHWRESVASVLRQTYPRWELCLAAGPRTGEYDGGDERIRFLRAERDDRTSLTNAALDVASGDFVVFLSSGDDLASHALQRIAEEIGADRDVDLLYSDEDEIGPTGLRNPFFKPGWSPEYLLGRDYAFRVGVLRTSLVRRLGGLRPALGAAAEYDLILRAAARTARVRHVPDVLYHARPVPTPDAADVRRAVADHLADTGRPGDVEPVGDAGDYRVRFRLRGTPLVSVIIPSAFAKRRGAGGWPVLFDCLRSIRERSTWPHCEIIVMAGRAVPPDVHQALRRWDANVVLRPGPFNFAATMNAGAGHARGEQLLLLNDDVEVLTPDWIESLLEYAQQPDVGAVGATLLFPHGRLQHVGIHLLEGRPLHAWYGYPADHPGYFDSHRVPRNYCAVTAACLMTRAEVFREAGGLDERLALNHNDVDYCLRLLRGGRRVVSTPYARLLHHEAFTKRGEPTEEAGRFRERWGAACRDPYYNPNFATKSADCRIG